MSSTRRSSPNRPPAESPIRGGYIGRIAKTQETLSKQGVFSLIDFHQDLFNERFQGEGWPDWRCRTTACQSAQTGFPDNYLTNPALWRAFDHFWANDPGRRRRRAPGPIRGGLEPRRAGRSSAAARVIGYDILNEPWPGSTYLTCANPSGCPAFDDKLAAMTGRRPRADSQRGHAAPRVAGAERDLQLRGPEPPAADRPGPGFSFHVYCLTAGAPDCPTTEALDFDNAEKMTQATGRALMVTEFSASDDFTETNYMAGPRRPAHGLLAGVGLLRMRGPHRLDPAGPRGPRPRSLEAAPRPQHQVEEAPGCSTAPTRRPSRGRRRSWDFDPATRVFRLHYSTKTPAGHRLPRDVDTVVFAPRIHYPHGYRVSVRGAEVVSQAGAQQLVLERKRHARGVRLTVKPRSA